MVVLFVVVRLLRLIKGKGVTPIFSSLQFHHKRLESLEHLIVVFVYINNSGILSTSISFFTLTRPYYFYKVCFVYVWVAVCVHLNSFCKYTLHILCYVFNVIEEFY